MVSTHQVKLLLIELAQLQIDAAIEVTTPIADSSRVMRCCCAIRYCMTGFFGQSSCVDRPTDRAPCINDKQCSGKQHLVWRIVFTE